MLTIKDFSKVELVAKSEGIKLFIGSWGKVRRFIIEQDGLVSQVGPFYSRNEDYKNNAYNYAKTTWNFKDEEIGPEYPRQKTVEITQSEIVSINQALQILKYSNSGFAEEAYFYLKKLSDKLK